MYMSPEQAKSARDIDHRTDVWGIALSLHEALCGERPWKGCTTVGELIVAICTQSMPPLTEVAPWVPPGLALAVEKGLARTPSDRWPTIEAFARALEPFARGQTTVHRDDLVGVPAKARASGNPRVVIGDSGNIGGSTAHATTLGTTPSTMNTTQPRRPRGRLWIGAVALAGVAAIGVALQVSKKDSTTTSSSGDLPPTAPTSATMVAAQPTIASTTTTPASSSASSSAATSATATHSVTTSTSSPTSPKPTASVATNIATTAKTTTTATTTTPPAPTPSATSPKPKDSW
jgi:hypothetical protein